MAFNNISQNNLKRILHYDSDTGIFTRLYNSSGARKGSIAGSKTKQGYIHIRVKTDRVLAHRLAWLYVHGEMPKLFIDHINHDKTDNRISNLRLVTRIENSKNLGKSIRNTSGFVGVSYNKSNNQWRADIRIDGKLKYLGGYKLKTGAIKARKEAENYYGFHKNHGKEL